MVSRRAGQTARRPVRPSIAETLVASPIANRVGDRLRRDVDFALAVDGDAAAESIARALLRLGYEIGAGIEQTDTGRLASLRLWPPRDRRRVVMVDLLFASSGIEAEIVSAADRLELVAGTTVPVATVAHLIAMKILSRDDRRRPQDRVDLSARCCRSQPRRTSIRRVPLSRSSPAGGLLAVAISTRR